MILTARVSFASREQYRLLTSDGDEMSAVLSGSLRRQSAASELPVVGDYVESDRNRILSVLPRRTWFSRRAAGSRPDQQILAANIDVVFIVCGLDGDFNPRRIDRYLVLARESRATPVVVLNKADVLEGAEPPQLDCEAPVVCTSTLVPGGIEVLRPWLRSGTTVALLGSSGAGKSSITNCLLGSDYLRTQEVRLADSRGRHTTTHRELFATPGGAWVIDTPGMRELQLWADAASVEETFADVRDLASTCRFSDCRHAGEPGCAVAAALASGTLSEVRLQSYRKLHEEVRTMDKAKLKSIQKNFRAFQKQRGR